MKKLDTNPRSRTKDMLQGLKDVITGKCLVSISHQKNPQKAPKRKAISPGSPLLHKRSKISVMTGHNGQAIHLLSSHVVVDPKLRERQKQKQFN